MADGYIAFGKKRANRLLTDSQTFEAHTALDKASMHNSKDAPRHIPKATSDQKKKVQSTHLAARDLLLPSEGFTLIGKHL